MEPQQQQQQAKKRSRVDAFLAEEVGQTKTSKSHTRLELARVKNKKERDYQKMIKTKEWVQKELQKFREEEATYEAGCEEEKRLEKQLGEDRDEIMDLT